MNRIQKVFGSIALVMLFAAPLAASADTVGAKTATGIVISPSGIVRVIGADVTAVGNGIVNAAVTIGNTVVNVALNISGDTKVNANGSKTATSTDIKVGDSIAFGGTLASSSNGSLTINAAAVRDLTSSPLKQFATSTAEKFKHFERKHGLHLGLGFFGGLHLGDDKGRNN